MKVWFLVGHVFPPKAHGGGDLFNRRMCEALRSCGEEVEVVALPDFIDEFRRRWSLVQKLPFFPRVLRILWLAARLPKPQRAVIFEDHYFLRDLFLYNLLMARFRHAAVVAGVYHFETYRSSGSGLKQIWQRLKERLYLLGVKTEVTISHYTAKELASLGQPASKMRIVPCGIDISEVVRYPKQPSDKLNLLFVGHYRSRKGVDCLVDAFCRLKTTDVVLHLVGRKEDPGYFEKLVSLIRAGGVQGRVIFHGQVDHEKLAYLYSQADVFVFPSLQEGFGIVLLEAMSYGLPIVASDVSAIPELVRDGENGLLVPPADPGALASALDRLLGDAELRKKMGEQGLSMVGQYAWKRAGDLFCRAIRECQQAL